jgi:hypothetical protein
MQNKKFVNLNDYVHLPISIILVHSHLLAMCFLWEQILLETSMLMKIKTRVICRICGGRYSEISSNLF